MRSVRRSGDAELLPDRSTPVHGSTHGSTLPAISPGFDSPPCVELGPACRLTSLASLHPSPLTPSPRRDPTAYKHLQALTTCRRGLKSYAHAAAALALPSSGYTGSVPPQREGGAMVPGLTNLMALVLVDCPPQVRGGLRCHSIITSFG